MRQTISLLVLVAGLAPGSYVAGQAAAGQAQASQVSPAPARKKTNAPKSRAPKRPANQLAETQPGKYLIDGPIILKLVSPPAIALKLCRNQACDKLTGPPQIGVAFYVKVTPDSGAVLHGTLRMKAGPGEADVCAYDPNTRLFTVTSGSEGKLVLDVTEEDQAALPTPKQSGAKQQRGKKRSKTANREPETGQKGDEKSTSLRLAQLTLYVEDPASGPSLPSCARLFPPSFQSTQVIDAAKIIAILGSPNPFSLVAVGKTKILIYSTHPLRPGEKGILKDLKQQIDNFSKYRPADLGIQTSAPFVVELDVPHAAALGDVAIKVSGLNPSRFKVTPVGRDKIRIEAPAQPECEAWSGFLANLQHLVWQTSPESPTARLFYLNAGDVTKAIAGSGGGQAATSGGAPSTGSGGGQTGQPAAAAAESTASSDTSGTAQANSTDGAGTPPGQPPSPGAGTTTKADPSTQKTNAWVSPLGTDLLVFGGANPGDDADVTEKKRIIAQLDLPRPEMIVNAWVMQNSSKDAKLVSGFSDIVARTVSNFNNALEASVSRAWSHLNRRINILGNAYFNRDFYNYVALRYVGELPFRREFPASLAQGAQEVLELRSNASLSETDREKYQACGANEYCLGYGALFHPLKPRVTDLLIAVIAAESPIPEALSAIGQMQMTSPEFMQMTPPPRNHCEPDAEHPDYCEKLSNQLHLPKPGVATQSDEDCRISDLIEIHKTASYDGAPILHLACFQQKAKSILGVARGTESQLGLLRAAIADFLFNYKMSLQYPHEFSSYDLRQSADTLNAALSPFIEGFNQDIKALQEFLQEDLRYRIEAMPGARGGFFSGGKQTFINNGIVSVRTISGKPASVDTTSQSFLDASSLPTFSDLAKAIVGEPGSTSVTTGVLSNISFNQAQVILGALQAFKPTTVQIGRSLNLKIDPRSLSGASAAEIDVILNADESTDPTYFGGPQGAQLPNTSRVAKHDTSTRVRVDSIKLFEVSSFSAELQRSRSRFPLLPPFVEIPYIGTLIGIPLPPAKQYHTSTAVLSAIVVPTAADLAYGLSFISDRIREPGGTRKAVSLRDLYQPVRSFNKEKIYCLAALQARPTWCETLNFSDLLRDPNER
jgi:hypothetical protein